MWRAVFALFFLLMGWFAADAQIVHVENVRLPRDSTGWHGLLRFNHSALKTKTILHQLNGNFRVQHSGQKLVWLSISDYRLIVSDAKRIDNRGFQHFRCNFDVHHRVEPETFAQAQFDQVLKIDLRLLYGFGLRVKLHNKEKSNFFAGLTGMLEYEEEAEKRKIHRDFRLSSYLNSTFQTEGGFGFNFVIYYQPLPYRWNDYRISTGVQLGIPLMKRLSFDVRFELRYDSFPAHYPETAQLTYLIANGLSYSF